MNRKIVSLAVWLLVCAVVLSLFLPFVLLKHELFAGSERNPPAVLLKNWEVKYDNVPPEEQGRWLPFGESEWSKLRDYTGSLTVRRPMPEIKWNSPYLFLSGMNRFEVHLDGKSVYSFHMEPGPAWNNYALKMHSIDIDPEHTGKMLEIRMKWDQLPFNAFIWIKVGEPDQILIGIIQSEWPLFIISLLNLTAGVVGAFLFFRRKERMYLWFAVLALTAGFGILFECRTLQWFVDIGPIYFWNDLSLSFGVFAFVGLYGEALKAAKSIVIRLTKAALLLYTAATFGIGLWSPLMYWNMFVYVFPILAVGAMAAVSFALLRPAKASGGPEERVWLLRGYTILTLCGVTHAVAINPPAFFLRLMESSPYFRYIIGSMLPNGLLLFMFCMVMVLINNVRSVHLEAERNAGELKLKNAELEQFHRNLEQLVDMRTKELEMANQVLSATMREKAETLAEVSVLEERNRIAHEMHDVVGHTLTAAIVQLEATKKLAARDAAVPIDKLDTVNVLVRKGLDDIRKTVRMLKVDAGPSNLEEALRELIRETIEKMEAAVEADIDIPAGPLGKLTEQVLYHALQEGLTNGIRHARCTRFRFKLHSRQEALLFTLWNDGLPYGSAKPGFGLTSMMERVHLLGGTVQIGSATDERGNPVGCELTIMLPLSQRETQPGNNDNRLRA